MKKQLQKMMRPVALSLGVFAGAVASAGTLDPTSPPGPTMHTLDQIYNQLQTPYNNIQVFDNSAIAASVGANNSSNSWTVPASVSNVLVECWGGGGGGGVLTGGGGGGYVTAKFTVVAGTTASLITGAGGNYGTSSTPGVQGGNTTFSISGNSITAAGGQGGSAGDPTASYTIGQTLGGGFTGSGVPIQYLGYNGNPGGITRLSFVTAAASDYAKVFNFGDGGDAGLLPGSGSKGGYKLQSATIAQTIYATQYGLQHGGGGGADVSGGFYGSGGRIIVRW